MKKRCLQSLLMMTMVLILVSCCKKSFDDFYFNPNNMEVINTYNYRDIGDGVTVGQEGYLIKLKLNDATKEAMMISILSENLWIIVKTMKLP